MQPDEFYLNTNIYVIVPGNNYTLIKLKTLIINLFQKQTNMVAIVYMFGYA